MGRIMKKEKEDLADLNVDHSRDELHILPLASIPLRTPGLQRARLIKNARLETALELFQDEGTGSGQVSPSKLSELFPSFKEEVEDDRPKINALSTLNSFDVYSLRVGLRQLNIDVNDTEYLRLSPDTEAALASYMQEFTKPLIQTVFGDTHSDLSSMNDLVGLFRDPDAKVALKNLRTMADKLDSPMHDIPGFLEDYGDIFLSLAYFRHKLDETARDVKAFMDWLQDIEQNSHLQKDRALMKMSKTTQAVLKQTTRNVNRRLLFLQKDLQGFWEDMSMEAFQEKKAQVVANHANVGGIICGLAVKMQQWRAKFPTDTAGPNRRAEFLKLEVRPGLEKIKELDSASKALFKE